MLLWQLCSLEHLRTSGFGCPPPRHGLQLLFWFANDCVTSDPRVTMKLQSHVQPEEGDFGFHVFGNVEELLPALNKNRKRKKQLLYFVVGNLNADRYAAAASLPPYVRENYDSFGSCDRDNTDRIIISYQRSSRQVEAVYVTEHDDADLGRFRHDGTFQVGAELIRALQNPQLDLGAFLTRMGYYGDVEVMAGAAQVDSVQRRNRKPKASRKARTARQTQAISGGVRAGTGGPPAKPMRCQAGSSKSGCYRDDKKRPGGRGFSFRKMLVGVCAIYVAFKCLRWWLRRSSADVSTETPQLSQSARHAGLRLLQMFSTCLKAHSAAVSHTLRRWMPTPEAGIEPMNI
ncbi:hypothetical protein OJAV_G00011940 [Oryzias javanicus]|uniref:Uncharacterized protein n=1 Tax=Oryzias javanicus TaxID=123683 RepID=A0A3S2MXE6_ORYJA|nr:hypothetical protein OJAV_G00011940 [Oryzias javanicus]